MVPVRRRRAPARETTGVLSKLSQVRTESIALSVTAVLIALLIVVNLIGAELIFETLGGSAFARPMRCGNTVCNIRENSLTCPADCACAQSGTPAKRWLGAAACCSGQAPSNGICCPQGAVWDGASCAIRVARDSSTERIQCSPDLRQRGSQAWVTCPAVYSPVCTYTSSGKAVATLPSDCQACVDANVAYYVRGECSAYSS